MNIRIVVSSLVLCLIITNASGQIDKASVNDVIKAHTEELRRNIKDIKNIYVSIAFDESAMPENVLQIKGQVDELGLKIGSSNNYWVKFLISTLQMRTVIKACSFRIIRKAKDKFQLINMGDVKEYVLTTGR